MALAWMFLAFLWSKTNAANIELLECEPPDMPIWGGYGPKQPYYNPGDTIHYFCDVGTFIGGNYFRICEDTGDWSGNTPVCDGPTRFSNTSQTTTEDKESGPELAIDGDKTTCSLTAGGEPDTWSGTFEKPGQLIRVMLFLPKGSVSYEVILVKESGEEVVCGSRTGNVDRYEWSFQNCPEPNNVGAAGLKIKSLTNKQLQICEIQAFVLTSPKCVDPRVSIQNGRLNLNRKTATLVCDRGYSRSPDARLECIREGVWDRKPLYCYQRN